MFRLQAHTCKHKLFLYKAVTITTCGVPLKPVLGDECSPANNSDVLGRVAMKPKLDYRFMCYLSLRTTVIAFSTMCIN